MSESPGNPNADRFDVRVTADSHFAWIRTRLAVERTMMAYLRTSVSLIGFGFGIVQFVNNVRQISGGDTVRYPNAHWYLGLALIFSGILAAVFSTWEYRRMLRYLWSGGYAAIAGLTAEQELKPLYAVSFVLILTGIFAFFAVLLNFF
ncbi:YidH family protein [Albidovulum sp.]|uniref:YidH family protein n=1 Tax=Albidovulum sp. TaxID=1872424 RepID=UPI0039B8566E